MNIGVVGGGILGLTLGFRLAQRGHTVAIFEAAPELGGLAAAQDYGPFVWDRYYHCVLPTDQALLGLFDQLGLGADMRWTATGTGYYSGGRIYPMSGNADFLRFPLLGMVDKARLGAAVLWASRVADPKKLYGVSAEAWLSRLCGTRAYRVFWQPLLKAKFGPYHDQVAAVYLWATLTRLYGARSGATSKEKLGYCRGGYRRILGSFRDALAARGAVVRTGTPVTAVRPPRADEAGAGGCVLEWTEGGAPRSERFDQVYFTGPTRLARRVAHERFLPHVEQVERENPTSATYLGVACLVMALKRPLFPYYVLNIADERVGLTGLIEMTTLIDRREETAGLSLVYVPRYLDSEDPRFDGPEAPVEAELAAGVRTLCPDLRPDEIVYRRVHRARFVQPLPLVRHAPTTGDLPPSVRPFQILNTSMLTCATLNNNEVVGLVDRFVASL